MTSLITALMILRTTATKLWTNWNVVLRICAIPLILPGGLLALWFLWAVKTGTIQRYMPTEIGGQGVFPLFAVLMVAVVAVGTYPVAVNWHRFELRGETPQTLRPNLHIGTSLGYLGRTVLLALASLLVAFLLMLPLLLIADKSAGGVHFAMGEMPTPPTARNVILGTVLFTLTIAIVLRYAMILPARALGHNMIFEQSKQAMAKPGFKVMLWLGLFSHLAPLTLNRILAELPLTELGSILIVPFIMLFWTMFGVALLTRLYDLYVANPTAPTAYAPPSDPQSSLPA